MGSNVTLDGKLLYPSDYVCAADLRGKDCTLAIDRVAMVELRLQGGKKQAKPVVWFKGARKRLVMNKTNASTIAGMYGTEVTAWTGQRITLYPTTTQVGRKTEPCIRVRDRIPGSTGQPLQEPDQAPAEQEMPDLPSDDAAPAPDDAADAEFSRQVNAVLMNRGLNPDQADAAIRTVLQFIGVARLSLVPVERRGGVIEALKVAKGMQ